jgi:hypothetical protein
MKTSTTPQIKNVNDAADFAFNIIKEVKTAMILGGFGEEKMIWAACNQLSKRLNLPMEMIIEAFEVA